MRRIAKSPWEASPDAERVKNQHFRRGRRLPQSEFYDFAVTLRGKMTDGFQLS